MTRIANALLWTIAWTAALLTPVVVVPGLYWLGGWSMLLSTWFGFVGMFAMVVAKGQEFSPSVRSILCLCLGAALVAGLWVVTYVVVYQPSQRWLIGAFAVAVAVWGIAVLAARAGLL